ncbi:hypothetical protein [Thermofilum sp.]|uniref:hypothetical protein n=1 Tax=Thermofilum sp. TaxID=1961369 RepID=UPI0025872DEA|nr:hypothetical protein [Thermofilum sp.]
MRVAAWAGKVKALAAARGSGERGQPTTAMIHTAVHRLTKIHDTCESTDPTLICYYSLPPPMLKG